MANPKAARIERSEPINPETKLLTLAMPAGEPLGFTGGQYVIVNTNIPLPGGKIAKRAYSILSSDADQAKFQIAVKKVGTGPGSNYMHETSPGAELPFSGPWGQFLSDDATASPALVLATDTGITAALGLLQGGKLSSGKEKIRLVWMSESSDYFLPQGFIKERIPASARFDLAAVPSVNHAQRLEKALDAFKQTLYDGMPASVFLSGDGALLYPFRDELMARGLAEKQIKIECFFNNPFKKIAA